MESRQNAQFMVTRNEVHNLPKVTCLMNLKIGWCILLPCFILFKMSWLQGAGNELHGTIHFIIFIWGHYPSQFSKYTHIPHYFTITQYIPKQLEAFVGLLYLGLFY